jgi:nucleotide-binding universal stress UspA family protein
LIEQAYPAVEADGVTVQLWPRAGDDRADASDRMLSTVVHGDYDVVIKSIVPDQDGRGAALDALDAALIRYAPCPVWLAYPAAAPWLRRVFAAVDPIVDDRIGQALQVLSIADGVAASSGAELHVLHAWDVYGETLLRSRVPAGELQEYIEAERDAAEVRVERMLAAARLRVPHERRHLPKGQFRDVLPELTRVERADLIVMGTRGRRGRIAAALLRPYAEIILGRVRRSVLVVKAPAPGAAPGGAP